MSVTGGAVSVLHSPFACVGYVIRHYSLVVTISSYAESLGFMVWWYLPLRLLAL